jgi:hypothetical protein
MEQSDQGHLAAPGGDVPAAASDDAERPVVGAAPTEQETPPEIDTGDFVLHKPSGEEWVVAYVKDGRLAACGWPDEIVPVADCVLTKKATPAARRALLETLAGSYGHRCAYARAALSQSEVA